MWQGAPVGLLPNARIYRYLFGILYLLQGKGWRIMKTLCRKDHP